MPTYEFIGPAGEIVERVYSIKACPQRIRVKGKVYKVAAFSRANVTSFNAEQVSTTTHGYPRIDYTLPKGDVGGGTTPDGRPIIKSQAHENELIRQSEGRMWRD